MTKYATGVDKLAALDAVGVVLWGKRFAHNVPANGWYWAQRHAARCAVALDGSPAKGVHGPFPTIMAAAANAVARLDIRAGGYAEETLAGQPVA